MNFTTAPQAPPFCPSIHCRFHHLPGPHWPVFRTGFYSRLCPPRRVQRYRCGHCGRSFSDQTFRTTYWLKRPDLLAPVFHRLLGCSAFRQIAREFRASPSTIQLLASRLGRHCLLFHQLHRPREPFTEPIVLDGFQSFEFSQFYPTWFHLVAGKSSHFLYGFTDSELRRSGRMTERQKRRRAELERGLGKPSPRAIELDVTALLQLVAPAPQALVLHTDDHSDYPRALQRLRHLSVSHRITPGRDPRTANNPLFAVNLMDLLIRHCGANHKRETIAFSKRRQSAAERLWIFTVWRNYMKSLSERKRDATPAMRLGVMERPLGDREVLAHRLFPSHIPLPAPWESYYRRLVSTRCVPRGTVHQLSYAF